jgi:hypothetical protein
VKNWNVAKVRTVVGKRALGVTLIITTGRRRKAYVGDGGKVSSNTNKTSKSIPRFARTVGWKSADTSWTTQPVPESN